MSADSPTRVVLQLGVDSDAIDDAARFAGWRLVNIIPGTAVHPRQLLFSVFEGGWLYLVDDPRFAQRWFQAEGPRQDENLERVRSLLDCEPVGTHPAPASADSSSGAPTNPEAQKIPHPHRPRLADHVLPRLHVMGDTAHLLLHDNARGDALEVDTEQFECLELADGTRDEEGIYLEASRRGLLRKRSDLRALLEQLHQRGELAGGIPGEQKVPRFEERPIEPLPGLELGCDGSGSCCRTYSSMLFDADEVKAAANVQPPGLTPGHKRVFLPAFGTDPAIQAVATRDGECVFLDSSSSCVLHARGAKPRGCRTYPLTLVDDGTRLAAVPVFECPCVERSFLGEIATAPPELPRHEAGLELERPVTRLRESFSFDGEQTVQLSELRTWVERGLVHIPEAMNEADPLHWFWEWGHSSVEESEAAVYREPDPPPAHALAPWVHRLQAYAQRRLDSAAWRSPSDRTRRLVEWMALASDELTEPRLAQALLLGETVEHGAALSSAPASTEAVTGPRRERQRRAEWAYVKCQLFGYQFAQGDDALRFAIEQRCARLLLARAMLEFCPTSSADDPSRWSPLTALESLLRSESLRTSQLG